MRPTTRYTTTFTFVPRDHDPSRSPKYYEIEFGHNEFLRIPGSKVRRYRILVYFPKSPDTSPTPPPP